MAHANIHHLAKACRFSVRADKNHMWVHQSKDQSGRHCTKARLTDPLRHRQVPREPPAPTPPDRPSH
eukprot:13135002-Alexandrium_andersonii.AAC.1